MKDFLWQNLIYTILYTFIYSNRAFIQQNEPQFS